MATNLRFLRGTYANLLNQPKVDGSIYITTDEPGLYVDYGNDRLRIGDYRIFKNLTELQNHYTTTKPSTTCLYYLSDDNILACYDGTSFKQINSQKTLFDLLKSFSATVGTKDGKVQVVHSIGDGTTDTKSSQFFVTSNNTNALTVDVSGTDTVALKVKNTDTVAKVNTANNKVTLTSTISGTDVNGAAVNTPTTSSVEFVGSGVDVATTTTGENAKITITNNDSLSSQVQKVSNNAKFITTLARNGDTNNTSSVSFTPIITYGNETKSAAVVDVDATDKTKVTFDLDVYTKSQIDLLINKKLTAVDAMRFKGKISAQSDLPALADNPRNGDTYIVSTSSSGVSLVVSLDGGTTTQTVTAQSGDLLIALGDENQGTASGEGYITANLRWIYVPSADDSMSLTMSAVGSDGVRLQSQQGAAEASTVFQLLSDDILTIAWDGGATKKAATFSHNKQFTDSTALTTAQDGTKVEVEQAKDSTITHLVTGLTFDAWGHVTGYTWRDVEVHNTRVTGVAHALKSGTVISAYNKGTTDASTTVITTLSTNDPDNPTLSAQFTLVADKDSAVAIKSANTSGNPTVTIGMVWVDF